MMKICISRTLVTSFFSTSLNTSINHSKCLCEGQIHKKYTLNNQTKSSTIPNPHSTSSPSCRRPRNTCSWRSRTPNHSRSTRMASPRCHPLPSQPPRTYTNPGCLHRKVLPARSWADPPDCSCMDRSNSSASTSRDPAL